MGGGCHFCFCCDALQQRRLFVVLSISQKDAYIWEQGERPRTTGNLKPRAHTSPTRPGYLWYTPLQPEGARISEEISKISAPCATSPAPTPGTAPPPPLRTAPPPARRAPTLPDSPPAPTCHQGHQTPAP